MVKLTKELIQTFLPEEAKEDWIAEENWEKGWLAKVKGPNPCGQFKNGNKLFSYHGWGTSYYAITTPTDTMLSMFSVYEPHGCYYKEKIDFFIVNGHETIHTVYSDGTYDMNYTR